MPRARRWTDEQLIEAVAASRTLAEVSRYLGLVPGRYDILRGHIARLSLDASHIPRSGVGAGQTGRRRWTDAEFVDAVAASDGVSDLSRRLGYTPNGGVHRMMRAHIGRLGLDTAHFVGARWPTTRPELIRKRPLAEILVRGSTYATSTLRRRLIKEGLRPAHCEECGLSEWRGAALPLHLDHINGDHTDNRLENLRILCPNCHSTTETWCRRKPDGGPA
jgi:hypothetical protein